MYDKTCYMVIADNDLIEPCVYFGDKSPEMYLDYDPDNTTVVLRLWFEEIMIDPFEYNMHVKNMDYQTLIDMADDVHIVLKDDAFDWHNTSYYI